MIQCIEYSLRSKLWTAFLVVKRKFEEKLAWPHKLNRMAFLPVGDILFPPFLQVIQMSKLKLAFIMYLIPGETVMSNYWLFDLML